MTSFKPVVRVANDAKWYDNALRFATREEAEANARDLYLRWTTATEFNAVESPDPVNYAWIDGALVVAHPPLSPAETQQAEP